MCDWIVIMPVMEFMQELLENNTVRGMNMNKFSIYSEFAANPVSISVSGRAMGPG